GSELVTSVTTTYERGFGRSAILHPWLSRGIPLLTRRALSVRRVQPSSLTVASGPGAWKRVPCGARFLRSTKGDPELDTDRDWAHLLRPRRRFDQRPQEPTTRINDAIRVP